jgi:hypothetical protein
MHWFSFSSRYSISSKFTLSSASCQMVVWVVWRHIHWVFFCIFILDTLVFFGGYYLDVLMMINSLDWNWKIVEEGAHWVWWIKSFCSPLLNLIKCLLCARHEYSPKLILSYYTWLIIQWFETLFCKIIGLMIVSNLGLCGF